MTYAKCKFCGKEFTDPVDAYVNLEKHVARYHNAEFHKVKKWSLNEFELKKKADWEHKNKYYPSGGRF